ncbi:hypothetical protein U062_00744 [Gammaproteobacteria bacterium MOLA455]|nr:hypothetical protein U062_00744 [Gammaproteobacteria bacterium MOLA455]
MVKTPVTGLDDSTWVLRYGDYTAKVYAVAVNGGILFANPAGDQVLFDGLLISDVKGLGLSRSHWQVADIEGYRRLSRPGSVTAVHACEAWSKELDQATEPDSKKGLFGQLCSGRLAYKNVIQINEVGEVELIVQSIDDSNFPLSLAKSL